MYLVPRDCLTHLEGLWVELGSGGYELFLVFPWHLFTRTCACTYTHTHGSAWATCSQNNDGNGGCDDVREVVG